MVTNIQIQGVINQQVFEDCLAGKRQAQGILYNYFSPKMFGICLRYASDYHSAEDILQEGFIKVFNNLDRFRGDGSFEGWMKRIFINTSIEYYRKSMNLKKTIDLDKAPDPAFASQVLSGLATADLLKLVQKLPTGYRTVFNLYAIEGFSHKEIGEMLKISEGTSKSQLARARETLKKMINSPE